MPRVESSKNSNRRTMSYRQTTVLLTPDDDESLNAEADRMGVTRSAVVRLALRSWILDGSDSAPSRSASDKR